MFYKNYINGEIQEYPVPKNPITREIIKLKLHAAHPSVKPYLIPFTTRDGKAAVAEFWPGNREYRHLANFSWTVQTED